MATKTQEARVSRFVTRWKIRLMLDNWGVVVKYQDKDKECSSTDKAPRLADMLPNYRYTDSIMNVYPAFFRESVDRQEAIIVHELCHIATWLVNEALEIAANKKVISDKKHNDIYEGITEQMAKLVIRAYKRPRKTDRYIL